MLRPGPIQNRLSPRGQQVLLVLLLILALISTVAGGRNAFRQSQDFQWSGIHALLLHYDPWAELLHRDPHHLFHMMQIPNYLPVLYVLLLPLGFLPPVPAQVLWFFCNVALAIISTLIATRFYDLCGVRTRLAVLCLFLMATPTRNSFGNGQQSLLVLFLWCLTLLAPLLTDARAAWSGIAYFKYNFAPAQFFYLFLKRGLRAVLWSFVPSVLATLAVWLWLTGGRDLHAIPRLIVEPLQVSQKGYTPFYGGPNLMDILAYIAFTFHATESQIGISTLLIAVVLCIGILYLAIHRHRGSSIQWQISLMATLSVVLFKHHDYDSVVLLLPICYALRLWRDRRAQIALALIGCVWYVERIVNALIPYWDSEYVPEGLLLLAFLVMIYRVEQAEAALEPTWRTAPSTPHEVAASNRV